MRTLQETYFKEEQGMDSLFHTTSWEGLQGIIQKRSFSPPFEGLVSFAPKPFFGDISGNDVVLEVVPPPGIMKVQYTEDWFNEYPDHGSYIAGEGWQQQHFTPEECVDDEGFVDDECEEEAYREAELQSFLFKDNENEWISKEPGEDIPAQIKRIWVKKEEDIEAAQKISGGKYPVEVL